MQAFGYISDAPDAEHPTELKEVTLLLTTEEIDAVIAFLQNARMRFDACSPTPGESHLHLKDLWRAWSDSHPDIIVAYRNGPAGCLAAKFPDKTKPDGLR